MLEQLRSQRGEINEVIMMKTRKKSKRQIKLNPVRAERCGLEIISRHRDIPIYDSIFGSSAECHVNKTQKFDASYS